MKANKERPHSSWLVLACLQSTKCFALAGLASLAGLAGRPGLAGLAGRAGQAGLAGWACQAGLDWLATLAKLA